MPVATEKLVRDTRTEDGAESAATMFADDRRMARSRIRSWHQRHIGRCIDKQGGYAYLGEGRHAIVAEPVVA